MAINTLDLLTRKTAVVEMIDESIVEKVIRFKWESFFQSLPRVNQSEDSGLAKFKIRQSALKKELKKSESKLSMWRTKLEEETDIRKKATLERKINNELINQEYLKTKQSEN